MHELPAASVGSYSILAPIERRGVPGLYRAQHPRFGRQVALKVLPLLPDDASFVRRFEERAAELARLSHPGIAQIYDFGVEGSWCYVVLEYPDGRCLDSLIEERFASARYFQLAEVVELCATLAAAVDYAHAQGIVHGDLRPINMLLTDERQGLLIDFSAARMLMASDLEPAQAGSPRSDVYGLGLTLYKLLAGHFPWPVEQPVASLLSGAREQPFLPLGSLSELPASVAEIVARALAPDFGERFESAGELAQALRMAVPAAVEQPAGAGRVLAVPAAPVVDAVGALDAGADPLAVYLSEAPLPERPASQVELPMPANEARPAVDADSDSPAAGQPPAAQQPGPSEAAQPPPPDTPDWAAQLGSAAAEPGEAHSPDDDDDDDDVLIVALWDDDSDADAQPFWEAGALSQPEVEAHAPAPDAAGGPALASWLNMHDAADAPASPAPAEAGPASVDELPAPERLNPELASQPDQVVADEGDDVVIEGDYEVLGLDPAAQADVAPEQVLAPETQWDTLDSAQPGELNEGQALPPDAAGWPGDLDQQSQPGPEEPDALVIEGDYEVLGLDPAAEANVAPEQVPAPETQWDTLDSAQPGELNEGQLPAAELAPDTLLAELDAELERAPQLASWEAEAEPAAALPADELAGSLEALDPAEGGAPAPDSVPQDAAGAPAAVPWHADQPAGHAVGQQDYALLSAMIAPNTAGSMPPVSVVPYRGLAPFTEHDSALFFGREALTTRLLEVLEQRQLVTLIGPSGSGKSSLLHAGLIARLRRQAAVPLIAALRPGSRPFESLAAALLPLLGLDTSAPGRQLELPRLAEALDSGEAGLAALVQRSLELHSSVSSVLLVVDQLEELFSLCPDPQLQQRFLGLLLRGLADSRSSQLRVVLGLRADALDAALAYRPFARALQQSSLLLEPMQRAELLQAIEQPALQAGAELEPELCDLMLQDGAELPRHLPLLQFTLTQLWERRTQGQLRCADYAALGGLGQALDRYAEELYTGLSAEEQSQARWLFAQLTRLDERAGALRRPATRADLGEPVWMLAQRLVRAGLLSIGRDPAGQAYVELAHETLIPGWQRLLRWVGAERSFQEWQTRLRAALHRWQADQRDETTLLQGAALAEAESWMARRAAELAPAERGYIKLSLALRERRGAEREPLPPEPPELAPDVAQQRQQIDALQRTLQVERQRAEAQARTAQAQLTQARRLRRQRTYLATALVSASLLLALAAGIWSWRSASQARQMARLASSRELAAVAMQQAQDAQRSTLLALHALSIAYSPEAEQALLQAVQGLKLERRLQGHSGPVSSVAFSPDGTRLATAGDDGTARIWERASGAQLATFAAQAGWITSIGFSPDGALLAAAYKDGTAGIWELQTGRELRRLAGHGETVTSVAFSPDGRLLATTSLDRTARIWEADSGRELLSLHSHQDGVLDAVFSPDGSQLATTSWDGSIRIWEVRSGRELRVLSGQSSWAYALAYSPDGQLLAAAGTDGAARIWDPGAGELLRSLTGHTGEVIDVSFSPDGSRLASAGADGTTRLWDSATGRQQLVLSGHSGAVWGLAFSPDGAYLATAGEDGTAQLDALRLDEVRALARAGLTRSLTTEECQAYLHVAACPPAP